MTRRDWKYIIVSFCVLSVLWTVAGFIAGRQLNDNEALTKRIAQVSVATDALLCLVAYAPPEITKEQFRQYIQSNRIVVEDPVCKVVIEVVRQIIDGKMPPPTVQEGG